MRWPIHDANPHLASERTVATRHAGVRSVVRFNGRDLTNLQFAQPVANRPAKD